MWIQLVKFDDVSCVKYGNKWWWLLNTVVRMSLACPRNCTMVQQSWQFSHVGNLTRQNHPDIPTTLIYLSCNWDSFDWGDFFIGAVAWEDSGIWKQRPQKHPENEFGCKAARKMEKKNPLSPLQEKTLLHSHPSSYPGYDSSFAYFF